VRLKVHRSGSLEQSRGSINMYLESSCILHIVREVETLN
jgi:hypothetical protein